MPRRHVDHQPIDLAALYRFELFSDQLVVFRRDILRKRVLSELD
tara:strand:- start:6335 stop:6466 length:132 start_codon:yes stop_codon:yes gene_type:complete